MAITNFIPEIWSASILENLRARLRYGQAGVINRDYEGDIARAGDTVHITSFDDPTVADYTKYTDITYQQLTDATQALVIDQAKFFAFAVDDIDRRQALPGFVEETTRGGSYNLAAAADTFLSTTMSAGVDAANIVTAENIDPTQPTAYELLVDFRTLLTRADVPPDGRWAIVPPEFYAVLLKDDRFIRADAAGTTEGLRNGEVGRAAGFMVIESNTVPATAATPPVFTVIAGHSIATTYAEQIVDTEALRLQNFFGDGVRGLHLYGGRVVRPTALAKCDVTISTPAP